MKKLENFKQDEYRKVLLLYALTGTIPIVLLTFFAQIILVNLTIKKTSNLIFRSHLFNQLKASSILFFALVVAALLSIEPVLSYFVLGIGYISFALTLISGTLLLLAGRPAYSFKSPKSFDH